ncbi:MAG: hypothetical protein ACPGVV_13540, partial [Croceimicrobium sp.]
LPRIFLKDVRIDAGKTTNISIAPPGTASFNSSSPGYGSILHLKDGVWTWVHDLDTKKSRQSIQLQPGTYRVVFRSKLSKQSLYSVDEEFTISSGTTSIVKLN